MGSITNRLDEKGRAFVDVVIQPSSLFREAVGNDRFQTKNNSLFGLDRKFSYQTRALIDTGASVTSIDFDVAEKLGLVSKGSTPVHSPKGTHDHSIFDIDLYIGMDRKNFLLLPNKIVIASDIGSQGMHMLIGTDILKLGKLVFDRGSVFSFEI
jgi:predicted aspartyl protease